MAERALHNRLLLELLKTIHIRAERRGRFMIEIPFYGLQG